MKVTIHVNKKILAANRKSGESNPPITVKTYKSNDYGDKVIIYGPSEVVYPEKPLSCGAQVWIETKGPVTVWRDGKVVASING